MPKNLLLIRHAKSGWDDLLLPDFQRPLNERGLKNAPEMAQRIIKRELIPQQIISSPALRALKTSQIFASEFKINPSEIVQDARIYEAHAQTLLELVNNLDNSSNFTALFGHNPGLSNLANYLCNNRSFELPTCGMILLKFPFDTWEMISRDTAELVFYDYPKNSFQ